MILATWNVPSLHRPGALAKLKDELSKYGVAIAAVQEINGVDMKFFILEISLYATVVAAIEGNFEQDF
jgi:hypothetical protein